ncbi:MAG TPA: ABC transporter substrate-binding protein [Candidatus Binataceae bacterium]|nr:ABC transporter substrate-binding protein [Candidatus Binataceae bacterium]
MRKLVIGLSLSLTGAYAAMGRQAAAALGLFVGDANAAGGVEIGGARHALELECRDDCSRHDRVREIYRWLCGDRRADLCLGPYSTGLTRAAAIVTGDAGMLLVNHGGAGDDLHDDRRRLIVSVPTPASEYLEGFVRLLATLKIWRKRVAIVSSRTPFARQVAGGAERACATRRAWLHGVRLRLKYTANHDPASPPATLIAALRRNRINALVSAGSFDHDVAIMRAVIASSSSIPVLGCVAAGVTGFAEALGADADGIVGPSQWEHDRDAPAPELGPSAAEFARRMRAHDAAAGCDYPAAQAYAAGLLSLAALRAAGKLDQLRLRAAFSALRTSTMFGDFAIDPLSGRQVGHRMLLVQWHNGRKVLIDAEPDPNAGALEFPSGWRLMAASFGWLRLYRRDEPYADSSAEDDDDEKP